MKVFYFLITYKYYVVKDRDTFIFNTLERM